MARLAPYVKYGASEACTFGAATAMAEVEIYTTMFCPFCSRARALLERKGVDFTEIDIMEEPGRRDEMIRRAGGRRTVPQIFINGEHIGGFGGDVAPPPPRRPLKKNWAHPQPRARARGAGRSPRPTPLPAPPA